MRAVRLYGIGDLRAEAMPPPAAPTGDRVQLKVLAAGICGSDLHNFRTGMWPSRLPSVPGHELCGEVVAVGPKVTSFAIGDRVVADSRVGCGICPACRGGAANLCDRLGFVGEVCDGGFAEMTVLPESGLVRIGNDLPETIAAMAEPLAVALHAVNRLAAPQGEPILIVGGGPIGGLIALVLARRGIGPLYIVERNPTRARLVADISGAEPASLDTAPPTRFAVDATGHAGVAMSLVSRAARGGRIALVGIFHQRLDLDANLIVEREIDLVGCSAFAGELPEAARLLPRLAGALAKFVEGPITLAEVPGAYRRLIAGECGKLKVIVDPVLG